MNLSLFDQSPAANQPPIDAQTAATEPRFADGSSIRRTVIHRYGSFLQLQRCPSPPCACLASHPPREYKVLELEDGRVFDEFLDTRERVRSRFSREEVQQGIDGKKFREVVS